MKKIPSSIVSILAGILLVFVSYRLDSWSHISRPSVLQQDGVREYLSWMASAYFIDFLMASLLLLWLWFTQRNVQKHPVFAFICVLLGVAMPIYSMIMISISMSINSPSFVVYYPIAPLSLASFTSAFIFCFGLQRLIFRQAAI